MIDSSIALSGKPVEVPNQLSQLGQMYQIQGAMNQNNLAQYQLAAAQRMENQQNALSAHIQSPEFDINNPTSLLKFGAPGAATMKTLNEAAKAQRDSAHVAAQTDKLTTETLSNTLDNFNKFNSPMAAANAGPAGVEAYTRAMYSHPLLGPLAEKMKPVDQAVQDSLAMYAQDPKMWAVAHADLKGADVLAALKGTQQNTNLGNVNRGQAIDAFGRVVPGSTVNTPIGQSPDNAATNYRMQQEGALNRDARKQIASTRAGGAELTPEQTDALYGPDGSIARGLLDPYKVTGRTAKILANAAIANPDLDLNKFSQTSVLMRNVQTVNKSMQLEMMPEILANVTAAGKKVNYPDAQFAGQIEKFAKGQLNDPDFVNYMAQRNDALLTMAGVMRGNGATDKAHAAEIEAASPTMPPRALDAWMAGQMTALAPRLRNAAKILRTPGSGGAAPAPATGVDTSNPLLR